MPRPPRHTTGAPVPRRPRRGARRQPLPARLAIDDVVRAGFDEGLKPGYAVAFPEDVVDDDGTTTFGSYAAANPWPARSQDARTVYLDQFSGEAIGTEDLYGYGAIMRTSDYAISMHMGTQFGLVNRVLVTVGCLGLLWSVVSAAVMYVKRRRPGSAGLPRRPADLGLANRLVLIAVVLGLIYPLWGVSALVVLAVDRFVIRRWSRTRRAFGQREASPSPST